MTRACRSARPSRSSTPCAHAAGPWSTCASRTKATASSSSPTASRDIRPSASFWIAGCWRLLRHAREGEAADLERGHAGGDAFAAEARLAADGLDVAQRVQVALRIAQALDRTRHFSVLDHERAVARHACDDDVEWVDDA